MHSEKRPKVGVATFVLKDGKVLMLRRKGAHGPGSWGAPGGHLEFGESIEEGGRREILEETGIHVKNFRLGPYTNDVFEKEDKHYITIFAIADYDSEQVDIKEFDYIDKLEWFEWSNLPENLFLPIQTLVKQGFNPFEVKG